jgi:hypothetical protein
MLPPEDTSKIGAAPTLFWFRSRSGVKAQGMFQDVPDLKPGETLQIKLQQRYYDAFQKMIEKIGLSNSGEIKDAIIWVKTIGFSDGTIWGYGSYYKPDPNDPTKWVRIEKVSLRSADERSSVLLSSPSSQLFCPPTYKLEADYIFCVYTPCRAIVFYSTGEPGDYAHDHYAYSDCFSEGGGDVCNDRFPEDVWYPCPLPLVESSKQK